MGENTVKIGHLLFMIFMIGIIIVVGTYAWLSYRSNDTAMVLTIGEINNVQVTLSPYQIKASLLPQVTYTSDNYVTVTAVNNSTSPRKINLYYKINSIDNELISSNFKYTIERSTDGTTYTQYQTGNFSSASNGAEITILEESVPGNSTTYQYKVYLWLDGTNSGQSYMQGKSFNGELRAAIMEREYIFNYTGGEQKFVVPVSGTYKLEVWGAQGGNSRDINGGYGAYASGIANFTTNTNIYIYVGGQGESNNTWGLVGKEILGGYNGGGSVPVNTNCCGGHMPSAGGGATHLSYVSGLLSTLENNKDKIILVAGGGGGAFKHTNEDYNYDSGNGVGFESFFRRGYKTTQTSGYAFGLGGQGTDTARESGGGGYYGGILSGGSSYIGNLTNAYMACNNCPENDGIETPSYKTNSVDCFNNIPLENCAKIGDGYAKITFIS